MAQLPPRTIFHILQKDQLQQEWPIAQQTLLPNVGRESHSFLRHFASCAAGDTSQPPPWMICSQGNPFEHNPNFIEDVAALVVAHLASVEEDLSPAASSTAMLPPLLPFVPLGIYRGGERLLACDASGAPHQAKLVPIAQTWRLLFGEFRPPPLWFIFTPGAFFAVPSRLVMRRPTAFYEAALAAPGLSENVDPIVGHAFERLWLYVFLEEDEIASFLEALQCDYKTAPRGYS